MADLMLTSVTPANQRNGEWLLLNGSGFSGLGKDTICNVFITSLSRRVYNTLVIVNGGPNETEWEAFTENRSDTQIILRIGIDIEPGEYSVQVEVKTNGTSYISDRVPYEIKPWKFVINFIDIYCIDESNELSDSDEILFASAVAKDDLFTIKSSSKYSVDSGKVYQMTSKDFEALSPGFEVSRQLVLIVRLYELDDDEKEVFAFDYNRYSTRARMAIDAHDDTLNVVPEVKDLLAAELASQINLLWEEMSKNNLGMQSMVWSVGDLLQQTLNETRSFIGEFLFENQDSEGSHKLRYEVVRVD